MIQFSKTYHDIFDVFLPSGKRICLNQGGTRSGKTFSTEQALIETAIRGAALDMEGLVVSTVRKTFPALRASSYRDFVTILKRINMYNVKDHNRSDHEYHLGNSLFEFFSVDQSEKVKGRERDILYVNEVNELTMEDWRQLLLRTKGKIIADFNPSDEIHWIYDEIMTREDCITFITTYKDNPHLPPELIAEIERYEDIDENYWNVYGLGLRGVSGTTVYRNWQLVDSIPDGGERHFGLDFGFNNPSSLILVVKRDEGIYLDEWLYESYLTTPDLIRKMKEMSIGKTPVKCDHELDRIEELKRAGFNASPGKKDVKEGIDKLKSVKVFLTKRSVNLDKERKTYKWKVDSSGRVLDEPVKLHDHAMDASRYGAYELIKDRKIVARPAQLV